jgi:hypothetical protein
LAVRLTSRSRFEARPRSALLTALACEDDPALADHAFAVGLLHNLGRVAQTSTRQARPAFSTVAPSEGVDDAIYAEAAGREIARALELPEEIAEALLPCGMKPREATSLVLIASAACDAAHRLGFVDQVTRDPQPMPDAAARERVEAALASIGGRPRLAEHLRALMVAAQNGAMPVSNIA